MSDRDLREMFSQDGLRVVSAETEVQQGGLSHGRRRAFVEFSRYDEAERAVAEFNGADVNGDRINVRPYKSEGPHDEARGSSGGGYGGGSTITVTKRGAGGGGGGRGGATSNQVRIKVDNLPPTIRDEDLRDIFASIGGGIVDYKVKGSGRDGTWGVVTWEGPRAHDNARRAIQEFEGADVNGYSITVVMDKMQPW